LEFMFDQDFNLIIKVKDGYPYKNFKLETNDQQMDLLSEFNKAHNQYYQVESWYHAESTTERERAQWEPVYRKAQWNMNYLVEMLKQLGVPEAAIADTMNLPF
jgi:hypothetical protein